MTDQQFSKGDLVRKGNGATIYRVTHVQQSSTRGTLYGVCKASTATDPARTCMYPAERFTAVTA